MTKVSIIIAVKSLNDHLKECLEACVRLTYRDYEILVLPDNVFDYHDPRVQIIPTGHCLPAEKRDIGSRHAKGEILAFLDDDAYPAESWLSRAVENFSDINVAAVGGPGLTPPSENFLSRAGGLVYESFAVSGSYRYRYLKGKKRMEVDDYPSCNLLVRKDIFQELGGFKTDFWPGEDTVLCLEITKKRGKKIIYDPEVVVFHHRRPLFESHLKQIQRYALHRGYFVKRFPETSCKWQYFVPSVFLIWLVAGFFLSFYGTFLPLYVFSLLCYGSFVYINSYQAGYGRMSAYVTAGSFLTHLYYGFYFILGLMMSKLEEEAR